MKFKLVEPLRCLFKDEVRVLGLELGLPKEIVWRQPSPALASPCVAYGRHHREKLRIVREADAIVVEEMKSNGLYHKIWQSFAVLLPCRSVGVMGTNAPTISPSPCARGIAGRHDRRLGEIALRILEKFASPHH